jgi:hypothetical protein
MIMSNPFPHYILRDRWSSYQSQADTGTKAGTGRQGIGVEAILAGDVGGK